MRLWFTSTRGMLRRGRPRQGIGSVTTLLLETLPPVFNVALTALLSYYAVYLNPGQARWQLAAGFVVLQLAANWAMFVRHRSAVVASPKNFPGYQHRYPSLSSSRDPGAVDTAALERYRSQWRECESCDMHVPRRTHHCGHCGRCILVLDHHCYFLGQCVGRLNMRFFLVFCFYACAGCALGVYNLVDVMLFYRDPWSWAEAPYYVLPYTAVMYFMGRAAAFEVLYVALINFGVGGAGACAFLFLLGLGSVFSGRTPYEERRRKKATVVNYDRLSEEEEEECKGPLERFAEVFGECGLMHFLVPVVPFTESALLEPPVGYRRIIVYNNDYVQNGNICSSEAALDYEP